MAQPRAGAKRVTAETWPTRLPAIQSEATAWGVASIDVTTDTAVSRANLTAPTAAQSAAADGATVVDTSPGISERVWDRWMLLVVVVGAALRFFGISRQSMWYDELFTVFASMQSVPKIIETSSTDTSPPLFYLVESAVMQVFGKSEFAMRLVPALAGVLTIWVIYLVGKKLFNAKAAFWAATLFAVSYMPLRYAQEARAYSFLMLFAALGLLTLLRLAEKPGWPTAIAFSAVLVLTVYNHPYGIFGGTALVICMLAIPSLRRRCGWWGVGAAGVAALLFVPWGLITINQARAVSGYVDQGTWHLTAEKNFIGSFWAAIDTFTPWPYPPLWATVVFVFVILSGFYAARPEPKVDEDDAAAPPRKPRKSKVNPAPPVHKDTTIVWNEETYTSSTSVVAPAAESAGPATPFKLTPVEAVLLLGVTMLFPIVVGLLLSMWVLPIQELRCFLIGLPAAYLLGAFGVTSFKRWVGLTLLGVLVFTALLGAPQFYTERSKGYYREAVRYLLENDAQKGKIIVSSNFLPLNINTYAIIEGYDAQFDLEAVKWWHQGEQLDEDLQEVLKNRESVYIVTAFVPFTEGEATAFDDSMARADGWKLVEERNFDNLPKVQKWVLGGSSEDPSATAPATVNEPANP